MDHLRPPAGADDGDVMEMLRSRGLRMTPQRRAIVAEVMRTDGHISPTAVARKVQGDMPGVNASTVYRTLRILLPLPSMEFLHISRSSSRSNL